MAEDKFKVIIVGAGPVGLYMAHALHRAGVDFVVLERQKLVVNYFGAMVFIWPQTVRLLDQIGLYDHAKRLSVGIHVKKRVCGLDGSVMTTSGFWDRMHDNHGYPFLPILRSDVVKMLFETLPNRERRVKTDAKVVDIDVGENGVEARLENGSIEKGSIVIGADGVHSRVRSIMNHLRSKIESRTINTDESPMLSTFHGVVGRAPNEFGVESGVFYESRGGEAAIQCTVAEGMIHYATLKPLDHPTVRRSTYGEKELQNHVASLSNVYACPGVRFEDLWAKTDRNLVRMLNQEEGFASRWHASRIVLLGDSAHKTTSINGLGLTCGIQGAAALANQVHGVLKHEERPETGSLVRAFTRYEEERRDEARQIWTKGYNMIREVTATSWVNRFWDKYILPWFDVEVMARGLLVSYTLIRKGQILSFVPFKGNRGLVPWLRQP